MLIPGWGGRGDVRPLGPEDRDEALALCARDPAAYVYVAARIGEFDLSRNRGACLVYAPGGTMRSLLWTTANLVPVEVDAEAAAAFVPRVRRLERHVSSLFGPADQVLALWEPLSEAWHQPLDVRPNQPLMAIDADEPCPVTPDPRVRPSRRDELDLVVPAAAAMFTEEIGYPPYAERTGRSGYVSFVGTLIQRGHSLIIREGDTIVFKADIGSVGEGACQIQGVYVDPAHRGEGISVGAMAAVVAYARGVAPRASLYVNDYNVAAIAAYRHVGFRDIGRFATILL